MAAEEKPKMDVPLRTAQGVSRFFLFEALRTGYDELQTQHGEVQSARDKAEGLLVKENPKDFQSLLQDTHASIVEAIAETLSAEADESLDDGGVKTSNKYSLLVGQIKDAAAGVDQLRNINVKKEKSTTPPSESDAAPEVQSTKKPNAREPEEPTPRKKAKTKHASNTSAPVTEAPSSDSTDEKTMKGKGKKLGKPPKSSKGNKAPSSKASPELGSPSSNTPSSIGKTEQRNKGSVPFTAAPPETPIPVAANRSNSVEDITSEVDARLAAKELKRARKKESKKRKRDSLASEIFSPDPKATPEHSAPLPAKKKIRVDTAKSDSKGKRQNVDDVPGGMSKGKAKKQKTETAKRMNVKVDPEELPDAEGYSKASVELLISNLNEGKPPGQPNDSEKKANKAKRRRSSNLTETSTPAATQGAAPEASNRKKRRVGF
ncbi:hypothetical protein D6C76_10199 [Aureobasidium pullulans]|uniref:Uncharacterized protein n=1 Tax=Aureobasidium pullulans TaxID=5580 RepID=A0AB74K088_AURPU|nr:hypothetical protein D6D12_02618 [Aureobasidium pullulans]THX64238.1 hypothetical protein D6D11_01299 [Aureobasidium pullulans]THX71946.1 hypothetical protein D6D08_05398 [Aureobasidium pullulans]TIA61201.1 hypothetical protein D6C76_10199 [Aureobasidium pullulans]